MDEKPLSVAHTLAEHFQRDALDFAARFDLLWEAGPLLHKMGRTKSFVDLLMGCECALKCHCFLIRKRNNCERFITRCTLIQRTPGVKLDRD